MSAQEIKIRIGALKLRIENNLERIHEENEKAITATKQGSYGISEDRALKGFLAVAKSLKEENFELEKQLREIQDGTMIEDGRNAPERMRIMILTALESKPLSKDDLRDSINCDEKDFEKAFTQLWNEGKIRTEGFNLFGKEIYTATKFRY